MQKKLCFLVKFVRLKYYELRMADMENPLLEMIKWGIVEEIICKKAI
jgi:hypothetical protein